MFDILFDTSCLPDTLKKAKTISKKECESIYYYMKKYKPVNILEFGTQYGCSTRAFLEMAKWIGYKINLHSWDILDSVRCVDKNEFCFHLEDISKKEELLLDYKPNLVFLDAHPYYMTKNIMQICLREKINFICHDVSDDVYNTTKERSKNFSNLSCYAAWESYILQELIYKDILSVTSYENNFLFVDFTIDRYGIAIIRHKK